MPSFRKRPVVIEAVRFEYTEWADWKNGKLFFSDTPDWLLKALADSVIVGDFRSEDYAYAVITTLEGDMTATTGDWIIRGVQGELYPCKPDIFEQTYEAVDVEA
jgi:hypothetical protein